MKLLLAIACFAFLSAPSPSLLILDKDMKKPLKKADAFTTQEFMQRNFPVYASDAKAIIEATDELVRIIGRETDRHYTLDTLVTKHSTFVLSKENSGNFHITVRLMTTLEETGTSFGFTIVEKEVDIRRAQRRLLDFATYLEQ